MPAWPFSLALQNTLSNLAGGITLLASKPFTVGDYVEIGSVSGTVSLVGLAYTTLVTVENKEIYIPNSQLSSATIINYTRLGRRRMEITISASYDAPTDAVKAALHEAVSQFPQILPDPAPEIRLSGYGRKRHRLSPAGLDHLRGLLGCILPPAGGHPSRLCPPRGGDAIQSAGRPSDPPLPQKLSRSSSQISA